MTQQPLRGRRLGELPALKRRTIDVRDEDLVAFGSMWAGAAPVVARPARTSVDLAAWAREHLTEVEENLGRAGGILFRGFGIEQAAEFEEAVQALAGAPLAYQDRSSPRSQVAGHVYTSTDHPADQSIFLHNEQSYSSDWPERIAFCCALPAESGGRTPVADTRVVHGLLDGEITDKFARLGVRYVRNFGDGLGLSWSTAFQTNDKAVVEDACRARGMSWEWRSGGRLRTWHARPAMLRHPRTGDVVWFNHATFFHVSTLDSETAGVLLGQFAQEDLPYNTYYGDGSPIEPEVLSALRDAYQTATVEFDWEQGDLLLLDNMLMAHARTPYTGPRKILVAMAAPIGWSDVDSQVKDRRR
ncbi:TauD/TfdA family dioxygenase [Lentzea sp. NPDC034063]|uniref:TauD/TfdA family dioxygenase n=1 Tax=unclassified Lentzea TaxID=2643253 RepID=UPI0033C40CF0